MERRIILDSNLPLNEAIKQNPNNPCPAVIFELQRLVEVQYYTFKDEMLHQGQLVVDEEMTPTIIELFSLIKEIKFPIESVIPISDPKFNWDDNKSMDANNTSGFNYRNVPGRTYLSKHATGEALDINPRDNPYFPKPGVVMPEGAIYDPSKRGTIEENSSIVAFCDEKGLEWGGRWNNPDYQHIQKSH